MISKYMFSYLNGGGLHHMISKYMFSYLNEGEAYTV